MQYSESTVFRAENGQIVDFLMIIRHYNSVPHCSCVSSLLTPEAHVGKSLLIDNSVQTTAVMRNAFGYWLHATVVLSMAQEGPGTGLNEGLNVFTERALTAKVKACRISAQREADGPICPRLALELDTGLAFVGGAEISYVEVDTEGYFAPADSRTAWVFFRPYRGSNPDAILVRIERMP